MCQEAKIHKNASRSTLGRDAVTTEDATCRRLQVSPLQEVSPGDAAADLGESNVGKGLTLKQVRELYISKVKPAWASDDLWETVQHESTRRFMVYCLGREPVTPDLIVTTEEGNVPY